MSGFEPRMWTLTVPATAEFLTANVRANRWDKARVTKVWRDTTYMHAKQHRPKLPTGLQRVRIDVQLHFTNNNRRDLSNYVDAAKPCVDALGPEFIRYPKKGDKKPSHAVGYGLIPDDGMKNLDGPHVTFGARMPKGERGQLVLYITDLTGVPAGRTWTPKLPSIASGWVVRMKRHCNCCDRPLGDVLESEVHAAMDGRPLPDVTRECPACSTLLAVPSA